MAQPNGRAATPTKVLKKQNITQPGSPTRALYQQVGLGTWLTITLLNALSVLQRLLCHKSWYKTPPDWVGSRKALCIDLVHLCLFACFFYCHFLLSPQDQLVENFTDLPLNVQWLWCERVGQTEFLWCFKLNFRKYGLPLSSCPYRSQKLSPGGNTSRAILTMIFSWGTN